MQAEEVLSIPNRREAIAGLAERFDAFCQAHDLSPAVCYPFQVALDELLTNTISYGYPDASARTIEVILRLSDSALAVELVDDAVAFNPFQREAPDTDAALEDREIGGLGIHVVTQLMDDVHYERRGKRNHIRLQRPIGAS